MSKQFSSGYATLHSLLYPQHSHSFYTPCLIHPFLTVFSRYSLRPSYLLRNSLVPYIFSAAFDAFRTGVLPTHPLYYDYPLEEEAYRRSAMPTADEYSEHTSERGGEKKSAVAHPLQHCFGDAFVVAPITLPAKAGDGGAIDWSMWVPPGVWVDWWTGVQVRSSEWCDINATESEGFCGRYAG